MFERRLKMLLLVLALPAIAVVLRLFQLQVVQAKAYQAETKQLLLKPVRLFPFLRGDITDRSGKIKLAYDAPTWSICIQYGVMARNEEYLQKLMKTRFASWDPKDAEQVLDQEIAASWQTISSFSGISLSELEQIRQTILQNVAEIKTIVSQRRKSPTVIKDEEMAHPVVDGLSNEQQLRARELLKSYDWVEVVADQTRRYTGGPQIGHLLGRLAKVTRADIQNDPQEDDLVRYQSRDRRGVSGVEALGESWLRGRRGRSQEDRSGKPIGQAVEPQNGKNLRLTIDLPLQEEVYRQLQYAVEHEHTQFSTGGAAVLLDIPSREVIAMVSYPSHDPDIDWKKWIALAEDELREPTRCRAFQKHYPPGSTVKPMVLAAALTDGRVNASTHFVCEGRLFAEQPNRWRCTSSHGEVDPIFAIEHSCNVFFYNTGELMGSGRLAYWMSQFGLGTSTGIGLSQEAVGHLPVTPSHGQARAAAIGQSELDVTPLQAANMMATLASGVFRPVSIWADDPTPRPSTRLSISDEAWRIVREGMFRVVNHPEGTAYARGRLVDAGDYILMGKTGSAQAPRRIAERMFTCHLPDGTTKEEAGSSRLAMQHKYPGAEITGGRPLRYCPPEAVDPTHSWFTGYITSKKHYLDSHNAGDLHVAIAVVIEYGGHGGENAAPVAVEMIRALLDRQSSSAPAGAGGGQP